MKLSWKIGTDSLVIERDTGETYTIRVSNAVRNAANGRRSLENPEDVVWTTPLDGSKSWPYQPEGFPPGLWQVTGVFARTSDYLAPWFIATDAWRSTDAWRLGPAGDYEGPTGIMVRDSGFGIHYAKGTSTTLGCLRVIERADLEALADLVSAELKAGRKVPFEVSA